MKTQNQILQEAYTRMLSEEIHATEVAQCEQDCKRTGKTHKQLADQHTAYADQMDRSGQKALALKSRMMAKQHSELADK